MTATKNCLKTINGISFSRMIKKTCVRFSNTGYLSSPSGKIFFYEQMLDKRNTCNSNIKMKRFRNNRFTHSVLPY